MSRALPACRLPFLAFALGFATAIPAQAAARSLAVDGLPDDAPLALVAEATAAQLAVRMTLAKGWHAYGRDTGNGAPVRLELAPDCDFAAAGELVTGAAANGEITGVALLSLPLRRTGAGTALRAKLTFTVCDALQCLPPMTVTIAGDTAPQDPAGGGAPKVLLVSPEADARGERTAAFLRERGFAVTATTYKEAKKETCDAHDVVLCDSPLFGGQPKGTSQVAEAFPETDTPIVAVGFLGTRVLEGQKIAMACGYI